MRNLKLLLLVIAAIAITACHGVSPEPSALPAISSPDAKHKDSKRRAELSDAYSAAVLADGPTAYYRLDDNGSTAVDDSGNGLGGAIGTGVTKNVASLLPATTDTAMSFPGTRSAAGVVNVPQTTRLQPASSVSLEAWLRFKTVPALDTVPVAYGNDNTYAPYDLYFSSGKLVAQFELANGPLIVTSPTTLQINTTYHVVSTYNGTTASLYINGAPVASATKAGTLSNYLSGYGFTIGDDAAYSDPAFNGTVDEVAVYAGKALTAARVLAHYNAGKQSSTGGPAYSDWNTFGDSIARWGYNPSETTLNSSNAANLHLTWKLTLGGAIDAQPVVSTNVTINGVATTVLYIGSETGMFYAVNAANGQILWQKQLGVMKSSCTDLPSGQYGITGTATLDKTTNRVYVADGNDVVHALNMATGQEAAGWPATVSSTPTQDHIYGALTYNPSNQLIYAETAAYCEISPWHGRIVAINTASAAVVATFFPVSAPYDGGGIWGMGGAAIDATTSDVYVGTGPADTGGASAAPSQLENFSDSVVQLGPQLNELASNAAAIVEPDQDFGATPLLYQLPGCAEQTSVKNKAGVLYSYNVASIGSGPLQTLQMAQVSDDGAFIGVSAFDPVTNLIYVGVPSGYGVFNTGVVALAGQTGCTGLKLDWQQPAGPASIHNDNDAPTVANGVVYFDVGIGNELFAFNASTGQPLWNSGSTISGPVFMPPTVDGQVFVGSWDGHLYAFGL